MQSKAKSSGLSSCGKKDPENGWIHSWFIVIWAELIFFYFVDVHLSCQIKEYFQKAVGKMHFFLRPDAAVRTHWRKKLFTCVFGLHILLISWPFLNIFICLCQFVGLWNQVVKGGWGLAFSALWIVKLHTKIAPQ